MQAPFPIAAPRRLARLENRPRNANAGLFLLTAAPLAIPGGTGSPQNPIATYYAVGPRWGRHKAALVPCA